MNKYKNKQRVNKNDDSIREPTNNNIVYILVIYNFRG